MLELNTVMQYDEKYFMNTFGKRCPVVFERGDGVKLFSSGGKVFYDFLGGIAVNVLGHCHKTFVDALKNQLDKLIHTSSVYYVENQAVLAKMLVESSAFDKVFFANSGAEANEGAIKLCRKYFHQKGEDKFEIISLKNSFHGRTLTTATATGQDKYSAPYKPLTPGFKHVEINNITSLIDEINDKTAGIIIEFIQGESGVNVCDALYIKQIRKICDEKGILLIADEVQTGMGRTGKLFAYEHFGVTPDIMTLAKGLGGGVPIGALLATDSVASAFSPGDHGSTFGGNPFCTMAGITVLHIYKEEKIVENAKIVGEHLKQKLAELPKIKEVRGMGLMIGLEFSNSIAKAVQTALFDKGFLTGAVGDTILRLLPPLILTKSDADLFTAALGEILEGEV